MTPTNSSVPVSRRSFLGRAAGGLAAASAVPALAARRAAADDTIAFFVVGDTHFFADAAAPGRLLERSAAVTGARDLPSGALRWSMVMTRYSDDHSATGLIGADGSFQMSTVDSKPCGAKVSIGNPLPCSS